MGVDAKDIRILVVEDETDLAELIAEHLKNAGYPNVDVAANGHDAYNICTLSLRDRKPYHLIISDCNMPKMTGIDLLEKIRKNTVLHKIAFIMLTANGDRENIERAVKLGVTQYLMKPINFETLIQRVGPIIQKVIVQKIDI